MFLNFEPGDYVINPKNKDWGIGQIQSIINYKVTVNFENSGKSKQIRGGYFDDDLHAAKVANYKCAELGIPLKNPSVGIAPPDTVNLFFYARAFTFR